MICWKKWMESFHEEPGSELYLVYGLNADISVTGLSIEVFSRSIYFIYLKLGKSRPWWDKSLDGAVSFWSSRMKCSGYNMRKSAGCYYWLLVTYNGPTAVYVVIAADVLYFIIYSNFFQLLSKVYFILLKLIF